MMIRAIVGSTTTRDSRLRRPVVVKVCEAVTAVSVERDLGLMFGPFRVPVLAGIGGTLVWSACCDSLDHDRDMSWVSRLVQFVFRYWLGWASPCYGRRVVILWIATGT
jgi:hypothetical protein